MACELTADCAEWTDGCCLLMTVSAVAEDAYFAEGEELVAGETYGSCVSAAFQEGFEADPYWDEEDSLYNGFATWWDYASPEELEAAASLAAGAATVLALAILN